MNNSFGRFFVAVTFAVIGFFVSGGNPAGAALGFSIGSAVGGFIFPTQLPSARVEGPRLQDLTGTTSAYGKPIPIGYGTMRVAGNSTWLKGDKIDEVKVVKKETQSGGKGGSSEQEVTTVEYFYYATFRISFGEAIGHRVVKVWGDSKLVWDSTATTDAGTPSATGSKFFAQVISALTAQAQEAQAGNSKVRFYTGHPDQEPDFREVADRGTAPAYRGQCSIVFDNLALRKFGNRIPNITAAILFNYNQESFNEYPSNVYSGITSFNGEHMAYDKARRNLFVMNTTTDTLYKISVPDMAVVASYSDADYNNVKILAVDEFSGYLFARYGTANNTPIVAIDPNSLQIASAFPSDYSTSIVSQNGTTSFAYADYMTPIPAKSRSVDDGVNNFVLVSSIFNDIGVLRCNDGILSYVYHDSGVVTETEISPPFGNNDVGGAQCFWWGHQSSQMTLYKVVCGSGATYTLDAEGNPRYIDIIPATAIRTITPSDLGDFDSDFADITSFTNTDIWSYDPDADQCIGVIKTNSQKVVVSVDAASGSFNWITQIDSGNDAWTGKLGNRTQDLSISPYYVLSYSNKVDIINKYTGEYELQTVTNSVDTWDTTGQWDNGWFYDPFLDAILGKPTDFAEAGIIFLNRVNESIGLNLKTVVDDVMSRCNLDPSQYDNSELADTEVQGYFISRPMSGRAALQTLATAYMFDIAEEEYQLKSKDRGRSSTITVTQDELGNIGETNDPLPITRMTEQDLPVRVTVSYSDKERDYQMNVQQEMRIREPSPTMYSVNEFNAEFPIVFTKDEAQQLAEKLLTASWTEREAYELNLSSKHLQLTPADVVTVNLDDGSTHNIRLAELALGKDYRIEMQGIANDIVSYSSDRTGEGRDNRQQLGNIVRRSVPKIHHLPLLADSHDFDRTETITYVQASPIVSDADWQGCAVYISLDEGVTWDYKTSVSEGMCWGTASAAFDDPLHSPFAIDYDSTLTVWIQNGGDQLGSITDAELLTGAYNMARIGNEIINFRDVTQNADGSYTLSTFLRGRRGTYHNSYNHGTFESFYLLSQETTSGFTMPISAIGTSVLLKFVGEGEIFEDVVAQQVTIQGEDLKPYPPVNVTRSDDDPVTGDITFSWTRNTRLQGQWENDWGAVPLNEDTESYEVAILNTAGGVEIETLTSTTTSVTFDGADVAYYFGAIPSSITVRVYQMSAQVGRGNSMEVTLTQ